MDNNFDLVVIGGGPGGYVCAIRAAQLGLKTACVESRGSLGGTCLNVGCIPSKSLLNLSENYHKAKKDFNQQGIEIDGIKLNIEKMMSNKNKSIQVLTKGVEFLFKKNKVTYFKGKGVVFSKNDVVVYESNNKRTNIKAKNIVIATGSRQASLPGIEIDEKNIVSSTGAFLFEKYPKISVIGGGYIGLEMGSVWSRLGSNVTVVEYLDFITPGMDREVSNEFQKILTKQGINLKWDQK
jgi:dihydrolipoamide dehydrogenase